MFQPRPSQQPERRHLALALVACLAIVAGSAGTALAQTAPTQDAKTFASIAGIDVNEATHRLALQRLAGSLDKELSETEAQTFAGLWLEQSPVFQVVAAFVRDGNATLQRHVVGTPLEKVAVARTASATLTQLRSEMSLLMWSAASRDADLLIDVRMNRVQVRVVSAADFQAKLRSRGETLPPHVVLVTVSQVSKPVAFLYGGLPLDGSTGSCTSGFAVVHNGTADRGVTTAAHCPSALSYAGVPLTFQSANLTQGFDVEWFTGAQFTIHNWITDPAQPSGTRDITSRTFRASQPVGGLACKYGRITGYGCGYILSQTSTGCTSGGATWIYVQSQGANLAEPGDSGGPTFVDNSAYGQLTCKAGLDFIYEATDFVESGIGVTILTTF